MALVVKDLPAYAGDIRDADSIPGSGRSPGGGHGNPLQYSYLENPRDRGAWGSTVHKVAESTTLKQLGVHAQLARTPGLPLCGGGCSRHGILVFSPHTWWVFIQKGLLAVWAKLLVHPKKRMVFLMTFVEKRAKPYSENKYWFQEDSFIYFFYFPKVKN